VNDLSDLQTQFITSRAPRVSVVLPVRDAVDDLADRIAEVAVEADFAHLNLRELILVDDGSRDLTWAVLQSLVRHEPRLRPVRLRSRFGTEAAREAGVLLATGDIIITLEPDAPVTELGQLAGLIEAEHDVVTGWRAPKTWLSRATRRIGGTVAYRRETLAAIMEDGVPLALVPVAARRRGYRVGEVRMAPGGGARARDVVGLIAAAVPVLASERMAGAGMLLGVAAMLLALPVALLPGGGLAAATAFLAGVQVTGISVVASLVLGQAGRRARTQARIAETLLGHGARD